MWFKVDDSFFSNPKTAMLSDGATALWLRSGSWSAQQLTDGFIPARMVPMFRGSDDSVQELCDVGLWERDEERDGYWFHDWEDYQPDGEEVDALRRKRSEAGKRGANRRWQRKTVDENGKNGKTDSKCHGKPIANAWQTDSKCHGKTMANAWQTDSKCHGKTMANAWQTDGKSMANSCPVPVPVPDKKEEEELHSSSSKETAESQTADEWIHTAHGADTISRTRDQYPNLDMRDAVTAFTRHHGGARKPPGTWERLLQGWCQRRANMSGTQHARTHTHTWKCEHVLQALGRDETTAQPDDTACTLAKQLNEMEKQ